MNTSQACTSNASNDNCFKLYLNDRDISFLLKIVEKPEDILPVGQEEFEEIYLDIDYSYKHNIGFDHVETYKEIKKIENIIIEYEDIKEVSEEVAFRYITRKDQPRAYKKPTKHR